MTPIRPLHLTAGDPLAHPPATTAGPSFSRPSEPIAGPFRVGAASSRDPQAASETAPVRTFHDPFTLR